MRAIKGFFVISTEMENWPTRELATLRQTNSQALKPLAEPRSGQVPHVPAGVPGLAAGVLVAGHPRAGVYNWCLMGPNEQANGLIFVSMCLVFERSPSCGFIPGYDELITHFIVYIKCQSYLGACWVRVPPERSAGI
jgi:hypothetical protein